jgi:hypothetical protein
MIRNGPVLGMVPILLIGLSIGRGLMMLMAMVRRGKSNCRCLLEWGGTMRIEWNIAGAGRIGAVGGCWLLGLW